LSEASILDDGELFSDYRLVHPPNLAPRERTEDKLRTGYAFSLFKVHTLLRESTGLTL